MSFLDGEQEDKCPSCYWHESNGLDGEDAAEACRSPKWKWTDEETEKWRQESEGKEFAVRSDLPEFDPERHTFGNPYLVYQKHAYTTT